MPKPNLSVLAAMLGLAASSGIKIPEAEPKKNTKHPFTEEELAYVRSLPKKERKQAVASLKAKYAKTKSQE
jgi:hypothetical protein